MSVSVCERRPNRVELLRSVCACLPPGGLFVATAWSTPRDNPVFGVIYAAAEAALQASFGRAGPDAAVEKSKHVPVPDRPHPLFNLASPKLFKEEILYAGFTSVK